MAFTRPWNLIRLTRQPNSVNSVSLSMKITKCTVFLWNLFLFPLVTWGMHWFYVEHRRNVALWFPKVCNGKKHKATELPIQHWHCIKWIWIEGVLLKATILFFSKWYFTGKIKSFHLIPSETYWYATKKHKLKHLKDNCVFEVKIVNIRNANFKVRCWALDGL